MFPVLLFCELGSNFYVRSYCLRVYSCSPYFTMDIPWQGGRTSGGEKGLKACHWNVEIDLWKAKTKRYGQDGGDGSLELQ